MDRNKNLLQLISGYLVNTTDKYINKFFAKYYHTKISTTGPKHIYWMNMVRSVGGGEAEKPCEFIFDNPRDADLHHRKVDECGTWEYVCTVEIHSEIPLTVTNYREKLLEDMEYAHLLDEMTNYPEIK